MPVLGAPWAVNARKVTAKIFRSGYGRFMGLGKRGVLLETSAAQLLVESPARRGSSLSELDREGGKRSFLPGGGFQTLPIDATLLMQI